MNESLDGDDINKDQEDVFANADFGVIANSEEEVSEDEPSQTESGYDEPKGEPPISWLSFLELKRRRTRIQGPDQWGSPRVLGHPLLSWTSTTIRDIQH